MRFAWPIVMTAALAACTSGDDDGTVPEEGEMSVTVRDFEGAPIGNADVWTHDADGTEIARTRTAGDGRATLLVRSGGAVTARYDRWLVGGDYTTVLAVDPGDDLVLGFDQMLDRPVGFPFGENLVSFRIASLPPDTWAVTALGPCADGWDTVEFDGTARIGARFTCTGPTTMVLAAMASFDEPLGYIVLRDVDLAAAPEIVVDQPWSTAPPTWTTEVTNVPPNVTRLRAVRSVAGRRFGHMTGSGHFDTASLDGVTGSASITARRPELDGPVAYTLVAGNDANNRRFTFETNQQPADRLAVDFTSLPSPSPVALSADTRHLSWAGVADADLLELRLAIGQTYSNDQTAMIARWTVMAPPGLTSFEFFRGVEFPFLNTTPFATDLWSYSVRTWRADWWPDYATLRTRAALPAAPASYTTASGADGFTRDPLNP